MPSSNLSAEKPKSFVTSKTLIVNAVTVLSAFIPPVQDFIKNHPTEVLIGLATVNGLLRWATKGRIYLWNE